VTYIAWHGLRSWVEAVSVETAVARFSALEKVSRRADCKRNGAVTLHPHAPALQVPCSAITQPGTPETAKGQARSLTFTQLETPTSTRKVPV